MTRLQRYLFTLFLLVRGFFRGGPEISGVGGQGGRAEISGVGGPGGRGRLAKLGRVGEEGTDRVWRPGSCCVCVCVSVCMYVCV